MKSADDNVRWLELSRYQQRHMHSIRIADLEHERRRRALGLLTGTLLGLALWAGIVATVVALT